MIFTYSDKYGVFLNCSIEIDNEKPEDELQFVIKSTIQAAHVENELMRLVNDIAKWRLERESRE